jgi:D-alanine-D-alanine ligase
MKKTVLLFGGSSEERLVSVASAQNLVRQFSFDEVWYLSELGEIYRVDGKAVAEHQRPFEVPFKPSGSRWAKSLQEAKSQLKERLVFIGLHGTEGEDGKIQSYFEELGVSFTGSGSASSQLCFNKSLAKHKLKPSGIKVNDELLVTVAKIQTQVPELKAFLEKYRKLVFKPLANGSSVGLRFVNDFNSLNDVIQEVSKLKLGDYMVEPYITGREMTVAVIQENGSLRALVPSEVILEQGRSFDYEGKYLGKGTVEVTPAQITAEEKKLLQDAAVLAHKTLGCYGYSRTDFILASGHAFYLETNTLPGLTKASFVPQQLEAEKMSFSSFVENQMALAEHRNE